MSRLPRRLHPGAWWLWALGLVAATTQTTNPLLLGLIIAGCGLTVAARRSDAGWARGYGAYLVVAAVVVGVRVVFRILLGGDFGDRSLFTLPHLALPDTLGGAALGGVITLEEVLAGLYDGLRLGTILVCVGAANTLADPRRLVGSLPRAVGALATSVVVALSLAPQLVESLGRVRRARRLRGETGGGWRAMHALLVPVLEDTLHRSLALAASMDSRGYGRWRVPDSRHLTRALAWFGLALLCLGMFTLLTSSGTMVPAALLLAGLLVSSAGLYRLGRGQARTRYRPEPWSGPEWVVTLAGLASAIGIFVSGGLAAGALHPSLQPLVWPVGHPLAVASLLTTMLPAVAAPPLPRTSGVTLERVAP